MKRLSVIIVTYKSEKDIYDCLSSVWKHCDIPKEELEIIVVDNSPVCEPMFGKLKALYNNDIILIHNTHNGGYGQGNNVGIRRATAPLILIMNPDVRLETPFFSKPITSFEQDPNLMMYGVKQMYTPTKESQSSFCFTYMMNGYRRVLAPFLHFSFRCLNVKFRLVGTDDVEAAAEVPLHGKGLWQIFPVDVFHLVVSRYKWNQKVRTSTFLDVLTDGKFIGTLNNQWVCGITL